MTANHQVTSSPAGRSRRRLLLGGGAGALLVLVAIIAWLAWTAQRARAELVAAKSGLPAVRAAIMSGDGSGSTGLEQVRRHAVAAESLTHDPVWSLAAAIPVLGSPIETTQGMTRAVRALADDGMPPLVAAADTLHPSQLVSGGRLDVAALQKSAPALSTAAGALRTQRASVAALEPSWLGPVADAHAELLGELTSVADASAAASEAATLLPPMLGLNGPRRYFVAFQNPAEARASGGLLDAFAILVADGGRVRVERLGANSQLPEVTGDVTGVDEAFARRYGGIGATSSWLQANVSPHFPDVASTWAAMWKQSTGQNVDGAIALTPRALSAVLAATGPVTAPVVGAVDAARIEPLVLRDQYTMPELAASHAQRKSLMLGVGSATIDALLEGRVSTSKLLPGLRSAAREGHILVHSRVPDEQKRLVAAHIAGAVDGTDRPFAQAVVLNAAGNKLDNYLGSSLDYRVTSCTASERKVRVAVTLRNDAPTKGLPEYVTVRSDYPGYPVTPSQNRTELEVLLTRGAKLQSATLDGAAITLAPSEGELPDTLPDGFATSFLKSDVTRGRPSYWLDLELEPAKPRTLVLDVVEPPSSAAPVLPKQVMVRPQVVRADVGTCPARGSGS